MQGKLSAEAEKTTAAAAAYLDDLLEVLLLCHVFVLHSELELHMQVCKLSLQLRDVHIHNCRCACLVLLLQRRGAACGHQGGGGAGGGGAAATLVNNQ